MRMRASGSWVPPKPSGSWVKLKFPGKSGRSVFNQSFRLLAEGTGQDRTHGKQSGSGTKRGTGVWGSGVSGRFTRRIRLGVLSAGRGFDGVGRSVRWRDGGRAGWGALVSTGFSAKDYGHDQQRPAVPRYVSLKSDHVMSGRPDQVQRCCLGLYRSGLRSRNHRPGSRTGAAYATPGRRGLGRSIPCVRPPHRRRHHEEKKISRRYTIARWQRRSRTALQAGRRRPGQKSTSGWCRVIGNGLTIGSSSSGCEGV